MSLLDEAVGQTGNGPLNATLRAGVEAISGSQTITFTKYQRFVLPLDGFLFWVKASLLGDDTPPVEIQGSLHTTSEKVQNEAEAYGNFTAIFTSSQDAGQAFETLDQSSIFIADWGPAQFAFSRWGIYENAGIYHYNGTAIYPYMSSQIIDDLGQFDESSIVVSNSMAAWLHLNNYHPFYGFGNDVPLYPSMLVTPNLKPPFASVHVFPEATRALAGAPSLSKTLSHTQLSADRVRITFTGVRNDAIMNFLDCVYQYSQDYDVIGLMNSPVPRDEKVGQNELFMLAMRKSIELEVSYNQTSLRNLARQMIVKAIPTVRAIWPQHL